MLTMLLLHNKAPGIATRGFVIGIKWRAQRKFAEGQSNSGVSYSDMFLI